jgi:hypothetical protein
VDHGVVAVVGRGTEDSMGAERSDGFTLAVGASYVLKGCIGRGTYIVSVGKVDLSMDWHVCPPLEFYLVLGCPRFCARIVSGVYFTIISFSIMLSTIINLYRSSKKKSTYIGPGPFFY